MTPPSFPHKLVTPLALLVLALLVVFATVASGGGNEECHGNSPKKPCPDIEPGEGATVTGTVTAKATVPEAALVAGVQFKLDGSNLGAEDTTAPYEAQWDSTRTPNGEHALTATVRDREGTERTGRNVVKVDNPKPDTTAPSGRVTAPSNGATVSGTVAVAADASDDVGVAGVQFKVDGADLGGEDTSAPYTVDWDTTKASNAQHSVTAVVRDAAGNTATTGAASVTVKNVAPTPDTTPPSVQVTSPAGGATVGGSVDVAASASDNVGVTGVQFKLDGSNLGTEDTSAPYSVSWDTTKATAGTHTLTAVARDAAGNTKLSVAVGVTVKNGAGGDTTPPSVQLTAPAGGATVGGAVNVTANANDNAGVAGVQFKLDGANLGAEDTAAPYAVSWDTTKNTNAEHVLTAVARDAAGNTTLSAAVSVTVKNTDATPPSVQLTAPAAGATVNGSVSVTAGASDNVGVAGVQFKLDGANYGTEDTTAPYGVTWDTTKVANGSHTLTAVARDAAGNTATAPARTVTVSNTTTIPSSGSLRWPAPTLTAPQTILIPERGGEAYSLTAGKDYIIKFQTGRHYGPLRFNGGRNLVLIGGQQIIDDTSSSDYGARRLFEFRDQTGTIHIEGYHGTGPGLTEGINIWAPEAILQIQQSRIDNIHKMSNNTAQHPDIIQTWSGPKEVRMWRFTGLTDYQGFLFMKASGGVYPGKVTLEDVNVRPLPNPAWGGKGWNIAALWMLSASTEFRLGSVWVETGWWNGTLHNGLKSSLGYRDPSLSSPLWSWQEFRANGTAYGPEYIAQPGNTGSSYSNQQGDYIEFVRPVEDNIWNLARSGRTRVYQGRPGGSDFVSTSVVGASYSP